MAWLMMLLALACLILTFFTQSVALGINCMLVALLLAVIATMMLLSTRAGDPARGS